MVFVMPSKSWVAKIFWLAITMLQQLMQVLRVYMPLAAVQLVQEVPMMAQEQWRRMMRMAMGFATKMKSQVARTIVLATMIRPQQMQVIATMLKRDTTALVTV